MLVLYQLPKPIFGPHQMLCELYLKHMQARAVHSGGAGGAVSFFNIVFDLVGLFLVDILVRNLKKTNSLTEKSSFNVNSK